jgi:prepilin-type N-terminal cleavage/methylation domain-containing protein
MNARRGFSLVELLVVILLGTLLLVSTYQVLITNRRVFTIQNSKVATQQNTRAAMDVLFTELREVSSAGGDVVSMSTSSLSVRAMREIGVVCDAMNGTHASTPQLLVRTLIDVFEAQDSVYVFADNDEFVTTDDEWIRAYISANDTTVSCPDGAPAQRMTFSGQSGAFSADSVSNGAPIRSFEHMTYSLDTYNSETYLGRSVAGGSWIPLVGPLTGQTGRPGLEFAFIDDAGSTTAVPADVRQIDVTLRSWAQARGYDGALVVDSLSSSIFMRN